MSRLQELVNKLVQVIVKYNETQTSIVHSLESYSNKTTPEMHEFLETLIAEATVISPTRGPLLNYFLYVIDTVKPFADNKTPLSADEKSLVSETLFSLLTNAQNLLNTPQKNAINVKFNDSIIPIDGLYRGALTLSPFSTMGQTIICELFTPLNFSKTKENHFQEAILSMIDEHQRPRKMFKEQIDQLIFKIEHLEKENNASRYQLSEVLKEFQLEKEKTKSLQEQNAQLHIKLKVTQESLESEQKKVEEQSVEIRRLRAETRPSIPPYSFGFRHALFTRNLSSLPETSESSSLAFRDMD